MERQDERWREDATGGPKATIEPPERMSPQPRDKQGERDEAERVARDAAADLSGVEPEPAARTGH